MESPLASKDPSPAGTTGPPPIRWAMRMSGARTSRCAHHWPGGARVAVPSGRGFRGPRRPGRKPVLRHRHGSAAQHLAALIANPRPSLAQSGTDDRRRTRRMPNSARAAPAIISSDACVASLAMLRCCHPGSKGDKDGYSTAANERIGPPHHRQALAAAPLSASSHHDP